MIDINSNKEEVYFAIMHGNVDQLKNANPKFLADKEFMMLLAKGNAYVLKYADESIKDDEKIIEAACAACPQALKLFASKRLQESEKFVIGLAKKHPEVLDSISSKELKEKAANEIIVEYKMYLGIQKEKIEAQANKIAEQENQIKEQNKRMLVLENIIIDFQDKEEKRKLEEEQRNLPAVKKEKTRREKFVETIRAKVFPKKHQININQNERENRNIRNFQQRKTRERDTR